MHVIVLAHSFLFVYVEMMQSNVLLLGLLLIAEALQSSIHLQFPLEVLHFHLHLINNTYFQVESIEPIFADQQGFHPDFLVYLNHAFVYFYAKRNEQLHIKEQSLKEQKSDG